MSGDDAVARVIDALNSLGVAYMITGSLASNRHGIARSTKDADFVLESVDLDLEGLSHRVGPEFKIDPQMSFEAVTGTTRYRIAVQECKFSIELFVLTGDPHDQERFRRRVPITLLGRSTWVASPEDVIVTKLRWSRQGRRTKDTDDARNVLAVQADRLDWDYIHRWCDVHGTRGLLEEVRASIPPS